MCIRRIGAAQRSNCSVTFEDIGERPRSLIAISSALWTRPNRAPKATGIRAENWVRALHTFDRPRRRPQTLEGQGTWYGLASFPHRPQFRR
jgi:hypothetical protein